MYADSRMDYLPCFVRMKVGHTAAEYEAAMRNITDLLFQWEHGVEVGETTSRFEDEVADFPGAKIKDLKIWMTSEKRNMEGVSNSVLTLDQPTDSLRQASLHAGFGVDTVGMYNATLSGREIDLYARAYTTDFFGDDLSKYGEIYEVGG